MRTRANDPPIGMVIVTCGNPLAQVPNTNLMKKAFASVETVVVFEQFMTDTAAMLDGAYPGTINIDEGQWGVFGGPVNVLTSDLESDNGCGSTLYDCLVNIEKVTSEAK
ncbi:hypothetical protein GT50_09205 [Geobacillus stearothermophilus 10]|nr:hypothetical protein GT50_09205 [Geobacillus stearothermophilus 10]